MLAGTCGLIGGLIDIFLVGAPGQGYLTKFADDLTDQAVKKFAKLNGWTVKEGKEESVNKAIGFLEKNSLLTTTIVILQMLAINSK